MLEAECTRCGATFVPHGATAVDLIHCYREDFPDAECGGIGEILGEWTLGGEETQADFEAVKEFEDHGRAFPDCDDPHCKFHHPEENTA